MKRVSPSTVDDINVQDKDLRIWFCALDLIALGFQFFVEVDIVELDRSEGGESQRAAIFM